MNSTFYEFIIIETFEKCLPLTAGFKFKPPVRCTCLYADTPQADADRKDEI